MAPNQEESSSYNLPQSNTYVNKGYLNNEKPTLELQNDMKSSAQDRPIIDFDDLMPLLGEFGRYQKILFLLMIPFAFFIAFVYFSQIFITVVPEDYWCAVPDLHLLTVEQR